MELRQDHKGAPSLQAALDGLERLFWKCVKQMGSGETSRLIKLLSLLRKNLAELDKSNKLWESWEPVVADLPEQEADQVFAQVISVETFFVDNQEILDRATDIIRTYTWRIERTARRERVVEKCTRDC